MLLRMKVLAESVDAERKSFRAVGATPDLAPDRIEELARHLEAGAATRFYRGGPPHGRVLSAEPTSEGLALTIRIRARETAIWKLVETGAVNTVEVQPLPQGVDVFLKSVAATYPEPAI